MHDASSSSAQPSISSLEAELRATRAELARCQALLAQRGAGHDLRQIIDAIPAFVCIKRLDGSFALANQALAEAFGTTVDQMEGRGDRDFSPTPVEQEAFRADDLHVIQQRAPRHIPIERITYADGSEHWLSTIKAPLLDADGGCSRLVAVAMDLTANRQWQRNLDDQVGLLQTMLANLPIGIFMVRAEDGQPLLVNQLAQDLLGRGILESASTGTLASIYRAFRAGTDEPYPTPDMPIVRALLGQPHHIDDLEVERPDGSRCRLEIFGTPVKNGEGRITAGLVGFFDITARKRAEAEHARLQAQIQQTQKLESLGVLAGGIAHDFNNLLMVITGHADLAQRKMAPNGREHLHLTGIRTAAQRAAELCRQMLAYAGKASFTCEPVRISPLVEEMAHLLKASISKKAILNLHIAQDLPAIQADPSQIRQIILNLIINASDAIGDRSGVINISVGATRCDEDYLSRTDLGGELAAGLYVNIEVSDTGCGMDAATRARIFEPFFTTKFAGRGLGLAAVLGIVKAHGGAIKVYSEPGKGTTFKLLFPVSNQPTSELAQVPESMWRGSGTVLLADDEESLRALGALMLEDLGFQVITAVDGREAVELFRRNPGITLVVLDLTMPHMDGVEAFHELRRIDPDVRVLVASGYSVDDVAPRFAGKGLLGVLQKPYTMEKLTRVLSVALDGSASD